MRNDVINEKSNFGEKENPIGRKSEVINSLKLIKYSMSKRTNIVLAVMFFLIGLVCEILESAGVRMSGDTQILQIGTVFLFSAGMFPAQMVMSVGVSTFVQTSVYKKRLQTSIQAKLLLLSSLAMFTLVLVIRLIGIVGIQKKTIGELNMLPAGIFAVLILLYSGFVFKFFIASVVVLYIAMLVSGGFYGVMTAAGKWMLSVGQVNPVASILLAYVLIAAAVGIEYLITLALYKFPLSKFAFRCSRSMNS